MDLKESVPSLDSLLSAALEASAVLYHSNVAVASCVEIWRHLLGSKRTNTYFVLQYIRILCSLAARSVPNGAQNLGGSPSIAVLLSFSGNSTSASPSAAQPATKCGTTAGERSQPRPSGAPTCASSSVTLATRCWESMTPAQVLKLLPLGQWRTGVHCSYAVRWRHAYGTWFPALKKTCRWWYRFAMGMQSALTLAFV